MSNLKRLYKLGFWSLFLAVLISACAEDEQDYMQVRDGKFMLGDSAQYYIGTNYWYGSYLTVGDKREEGLKRLRKELDFMKENGVQNIRVLAGSEGAGQINGVPRVYPPLQPEQGKFDDRILEGLDVLLDEAGKRGLNVILFLSNNWEWSGGFLQYLNWNDQIPDSIVKRKLNWDELRDYTSMFYSCEPCREAYLNQVKHILNRTNAVNGLPYVEDPAIMAWELANEPRPMRPRADSLYLDWIKGVSSTIRSLDPNHLVTLGHEGGMATDGDMDLYKSIHRDTEIDYLTMHIWPKNWGWFKPDSMETHLPRVLKNTGEYIEKHLSIARELNMPLVVEEFGFPRDGHSFSLHATTKLRDDMYRVVFGKWQESRLTYGPLAGLNFWAFSGAGRPVENQVHWKEGDAYLGDPPMEEQGLNSVFDTDTSTWKLIRAHAFNKVTPNPELKVPTNSLSTEKTLALYTNLFESSKRGVLLGHQDDLAYGIGWKDGKEKGDVHRVAGDYPAIYGWELGNIEHADPINIDSVPFNAMINYIKEGYKRGSVITLSWHIDNPVNGGDSWDQTSGSIARSLPGGDTHEILNKYFENASAFFEKLVDENGEPIPVIFRPWHEYTGNWFWWGHSHNTKEEYQALFRYTYNYFTHEKGFNNIIWAYNTNNEFYDAESFLDRYPGDDVVDMLTFDSYQHRPDTGELNFAERTKEQLKTVIDLAAEKNKLSAFSETGNFAAPKKEWWTGTMAPILEGQNTSYVLFWRNHATDHHFVPYPESEGAEDFKAFTQLPRVLTGKDVENLYDYPKPLKTEELANRNH